MTRQTHTSLDVVEHAPDKPALLAKAQPPVKYDRYKRAIDMSAAAAGLLVTLPSQAVIAGLIRATMGRPVLFRQQRPGINGEPFELIKFRSMKPEQPGLSSEQRVTSLGAFMRTTSLDELPTLWNVLAGDMSIVGPRPLRMSYLNLYSEVQMRRHEVRPGITGLAQISGRNALSWDRRFQLDVEYVDHRSLRLDLRILARTVLEVFARRGIEHPLGAEESRFRGSGRAVEKQPTDGEAKAGSTGCRP
jgi:lipopolysaccharide/colanic/teichoic acid biosynthesis glycosyltransferase